jgi:hypothetical protein
MVIVMIVVIMGQHGIVPTFRYTPTSEDGRPLNCKLTFL